MNPTSLAKKELNVIVGHLKLRLPETQSFPSGPDQLGHIQTPGLIWVNDGELVHVWTSFDQKEDRRSPGSAELNITEGKPW